MDIVNHDGPSAGPPGQSDEIAANLHHILETIRHTAQRVGRNPETIQVLAATKYVDVDRVRRAYHAGIRLCGENRLQEALAKMTEVGPLPGLSWHFIGRVQRRKIKSLVGRFALIQSIESVEQAKEFQRCAERVGVVQPVLLEVNVGGEENKGGFPPDALLTDINELDQLDHLQIKGLMAIPPRTPNAERARPYFRQLYNCFRHLAGMSLQHVRMEELSMGMTQDYPIAIEEGATMVRIGSGIFGERQP